MYDNQIITGIILGIIEGVTEFLPVSSTGHLILAGHFMNFTGDVADTFEIFIQLGAILAVAVLYRQRFFALFNIKTTTDGFSGFHGIVKLSLGCLPIFISGFLLRNFIKSYLFSPLIVAIALICGGIVMIVIERLKSNYEPTLTSIEEFSYKDAFKIGLFQCFALCPGVSRAASTILGGILLGASRKVSAEFSFILAVPVMFVATGYDLYKNIDLISSNDISLFVSGFIMSFLIALIAIKAFMEMLNAFTLESFGWYRIFMGGLSLYYFFG